MTYSTDNVTFTEVEPTFTNAGTYTVYVKATNPNYADVATEAQVIINQREITFTADSASKRYDGSALTAATAKLTAGSVVDGQNWTVTVTGSQTRVGNSENIASNAIIKAGDMDVTGNYKITYEAGTLTVTASGGGGGGGNNGGGGGPNNNTSTPEGGPGTTTTILPEDVPLASLPIDNTADTLTLIEDEEVPLGALPKTGRTGANGLVLLFSSMMLAAFAVATKKKEEEN